MMTWPSTKSASRECITRCNAKWLNVLCIWVCRMAAQATGGDDWTKRFKIFERFSYPSLKFLSTGRWHHWLRVELICRWLDLTLCLRLRRLKLSGTTRRTDDWSETPELLTTGISWIGGTGTWHWNGFDCCCCKLNYYDMKCAIKPRINFFSF